METSEKTLISMGNHLPRVHFSRRWWAYYYFHISSIFPNHPHQSFYIMSQTWDILERSWFFSSVIFGVLFGGLNFAPSSEVLIWAEICTFFATLVWILVFVPQNSRENGQFRLEKLPFLKTFKNWPFSIELRKNKAKIQTRLSKNVQISAQINTSKLGAKFKRPIRSDIFVIHRSQAYLIRDSLPPYGDSLQWHFCKIVKCWSEKT